MTAVRRLVFRKINACNAIQDINLDQEGNA